MYAVAFTASAEGHKRYRQDAALTFVGMAAFVLLISSQVDTFKLGAFDLTVGSIIALTVGKNGSKLQTPASDDLPLTQGAPGRLIAKRMTMRQLASLLSDRVGKPVEDRTGLKGEFNFTLTFGPDDFQRPDPAGPPAPSPDAPVFETALEEQLGLRLTSARGQIILLIVDRVEKPSPD